MPNPKARPVINPLNYVGGVAAPTPAADPKQQTQGQKVLQLAQNYAQLHAEFLKNVALAAQHQQEAIRHQHAAAEIRDELHQLQQKMVEEMES